MPLSVQDILNLRRMTNVPDAQQFLSDCEVPAEEWDKYLLLVGRNERETVDFTLPNREISVVIKDPTKHWLWTLLQLNGCTYRQIAELYDVRHASVYEAVKQVLRKFGQPVAKLRDRCSLERMSQLTTAFAQHRDNFSLLDLNADASLLYKLSEELGD